jgi:DNA invertase Pin-like site-specific DNA recombinase
MLIGYSRVSTNDQSLQGQKDQLNAYGCEKIYTDIVSGSKAERPGLIDMLDFARAGDTVIVSRLDRLGRGLKDLINIIGLLEHKQINFKSLAEDIDTSTSTGKLIFHIFGSFAEFERNLIVERTKIGLASARARGRIGGRPPKIDEEKMKLIKIMYDSKDTNVDTIVKHFDISKSTLYTYLRNEKKKAVKKDMGESVEKSIEKNINKNVPEDMKKEE